ncbi:O-linked GlcNAc transferase [Reticulomyxa filosa]|uniref:O-linked GlcNAc transferase n=1 Tax=Reticulomyxa filosa TaxID=46433 RepID=X6NUI4_RETFI|nr:O-linked GlcNAc transferase [Reticulomyxa filosa]|eukprot:ETO29583.1 O-linked GlcNAc transferase [Reticulomyxa filosa]
MSASEIEALTSDSYFDHDVYYRRCAVIASNLHNWDNALVIAKRAISIDPNYSFNHALLADIYTYTQNKIVANTKHTNPNFCVYVIIFYFFYFLFFVQFKVLFLFFSLSFLKNDIYQYHKAFKCYEKAQSLQPDECSFYSDIAYLHLLSHRYSDSDKYWQIALEKNKNLENIFNYYRYGNYLYWLNRHKEALQVVNRILSITTKEKSPYWLKGKILRNYQHRYKLEEEIHSCYLKYLESPDLELLKVFQTSYLLFLVNTCQNYTKAYEFYYTSVGMTPDEVDSKVKPISDIMPWELDDQFLIDMSFANLLSHDGKIEKAEFYFLRWKEYMEQNKKFPTDPRNKWYFHYFYAFHLHYQKKELQKAVLQYLEALRYREFSVHTHFYLSKCNIELKDFHNANVHLNKAYEIDNDVYEVYMEYNTLHSLIENNLNLNK